jgi:hypothetical protein
MSHHMEEWSLRLRNPPYALYRSADHSLTLWDDGGLNVYTCMRGPASIREMVYDGFADDLLRVAIQYSSAPLV